MTPLSAAATELLALARDGRPRPAITFILDLLADHRNISDVITEVLVPVQLEVGRRWETNEWTTADEHASTAVIDGVLGSLAFHRPRRDTLLGRVLVACAEGEHHSMPARMGAEMLRCDGWDVTFLGGSLPAGDLERYTAVTEPDVVVISCTMPLFLPGARRSLTAVTGLGVRAVAAGAAFGPDGLRARRLGANGWVETTADLTATLSEAEAHQAPRPVSPEAFDLELVAHDMQMSCLSLLVARFSDPATCSPAQLSNISAAITSALAHLTVAVDIGDDTVFLDFVEWLARGGRLAGQAPATVRDLLGVIGDVVAAAGMPEAARICALPRAAGPVL